MKDHQCWSLERKLAGDLGYLFDCRAITDRLIKIWKMKKATGIWGDYMDSKRKATAISTVAPLLNGCYFLRTVVLTLPERRTVTFVLLVIRI